MSQTRLTGRVWSAHSRTRRLFPIRIRPARQAFPPRATAALPPSTTKAAHSSRRATSRSRKPAPTRARSAWRALRTGLAHSGFAATLPRRECRLSPSTWGRAGDGAVRQKQRGSALYLAAKYGGFADGNDDGNPFRASGGIGRPDVSSNTEWAEGLDADGQPKPSNYFLASDAGQMVSAIRRILAQAAAPSEGGTTGGALSSDRLAKAGASLYLAQSSARRWAGTLLSYPLANDVATGGAQRGDLPDWDAGALVDRQRGGQATAARARAVESAHLQPFDCWCRCAVRMGVARSSLAYAPERNARCRTRRIGCPGRRAAGLSAGRPAQGAVVARVACSACAIRSWATWLIPFPCSWGARQGRLATVYVGANDGMLHAFSASTGEELFAYVPRTLFPRLAAYTSPGYVHQSYVDGSPAVGELRMADGVQKTVLVSGSGRWRHRRLRTRCERPGGFLRGPGDVGVQRCGRCGHGPSGSGSARPEVPYRCGNSRECSHVRLVRGRAFGFQQRQCREARGAVPVVARQACWRGLGSRPATITRSSCRARRTRAS